MTNIIHLVQYVAFHDKEQTPRYSENATKSKNHVILGSLPGQHPTHHP